MAGFHKGLSEKGFVEGRNVRIDFRTGEYDQMPDLTAELVHGQVAVILAAGGIVQAKFAKAATDTIPIVFVMGADPVACWPSSGMMRCTAPFFFWACYRHYYWEDRDGYCRCNKKFVQPVEC
jgi:hypothetical protein